MRRLYNSVAHWTWLWLCLGAERRLAERRLAGSEENYRLLFKSSPSAQLSVDRETYRILLANQAACALYGYTEEEFSLNSFLEVQLPEEVESARRLLANPSPTSVFQRVHRKKDGTVFEVDVYAHDQDFAGRPCRSILVVDKTEKNLAAHRLRESQQALATAQSIANLGSFEVTMDPAGNVIERVWSDQMHRILGLDPGQDPKPGLSWLTFVHPGDHEEIIQWREKAMASKEPVTFEHRIARADGAVRWVRTIAQMQPLASGSKYAGTVQDVTELRSMQQELQQSHRLDSIGRLAGGVAHDFNNLLTVINGYSKLVLKKLDPGTAIHEDVQQIADAGDEAAELTKRLLAVGRKQVLNPRTFDLYDVIGEALPLLRRLAGESVRIEIARLSAAHITVCLDLVQVNQVLVNLTANARDAMPRGGVLSFDVANLGGWILLSVSDTGEGMDPSTAQRIFEPFFTTKERQGGTGLGLASVHGVIHQSGGSIQCFSKLGKGTRFEITLPAAREILAEEPAAKPVAPPATGGRGQLVMVVEDQAEVRKYVREVLAGNGYEVMTASGGQEALALFQEDGRRWDLLLTDVVMPGMNGTELAAAIADLEKGPPVPVLFMSGYARGELDGQGATAVSGIHLLEKPFAPETLLLRVAQHFF